MSRFQIAIGITFLWAITYIGSVATGNYTGFEVSTPVMLIVATFLFASDINKRNGKNGTHGTR